MGNYGHVEQIDDLLDSGLSHRVIKRMRTGQLFTLKTLWQRSRMDLEAELFYNTAECCDLLAGHGRTSWEMPTTDVVRCV